MGKHRFSLEPVLSYRESLVEIREMELAEAVKVQRRAEEVLRALQEERWRVLREMRSLRQASRLNQLDLLVAESYLTRLEADLVSQATVVQELAQRTEEHRAALSTALKDKKKLERLKEHEQQRHAREESLAEQGTIDELNTSRYNRRRVI